jgi:class 3 adenylate cyclase
MFSETRYALNGDLRVAGECEVRGDDIGGIGVHIGARVSALAGANEVLVSSTLRDLVIGVPGEWRLFAVASP